jgi:uncharacterized protein YuzE
MEIGRNAMSIDYVQYDSEVDALRIATNSGGATSSSLWYNSDIVVDLATEDGQDIVGLGVLCASVYLPLGKKGYDAETDTLLMGDSTSDPALITENGDFIGYWKMYKDVEVEEFDPVGVALKQASVHLAKVNAILGDSYERTL